MSEEMIPDVEITSDVLDAESVENTEAALNYSEKTLAELVKLFEELITNEDRLKMSKEAEAIKAAFYRRLQKEKAEAGIVLAEGEETTVENPFSAIELGFKDLYNNYRKERAEYNSNGGNNNEIN